RWPHPVSNSMSLNPRCRAPVPLSAGASSFVIRFAHEPSCRTRRRRDFRHQARYRHDDGLSQESPSPTLVLTLSWVEPTVSSPEITEFRAHAFQAAVSKAREFGWIV